ncbi:hypothetical protein K3495_g7648 [Podosphaera aphanis]|nr:hypothetical protein K3495_g7648 [Podosphaera aphanis]
MGAQNVGASGRARGFEVFRRWSQLRSPLDLTVFSDGSLDRERKVGADFCVYRGSQEILSGRIPLGHTAQVYDAEIAEAVAGLRAAFSHFMARFATNVAVCLDNEEAAIRLHIGCPTPSSFTRILEFQSLRDVWTRRVRAAATEVGTVQVRWTPGHQGIPRNERADKLAKEPCDLKTCNTEASVARARSLLEERYRQDFAAYWERNAPKRYQDLHIGISLRLPPELLLPRRCLGKLLAARSEYSDFADYHRRFNHNEAELYCSCGQEKSPEHLFSADTPDEIIDNPGTFHAPIQNPLLDGPSGH